MKRFAFILSVSLVGFIASCTHVSDDDIDPDAVSKLAKCPLRSISSPTGAPFYSFEYTLKRIKRIVTHESGEVATTFNYDSKDRIEEMLIKVADNSVEYTVLFDYNNSGQINKSRTFIRDFQFMTNEFTYSGDHISNVSTQFDIFGSTVKGKTRVEYQGDNVSKVFTQIDGFPELLTFEGISYDNKPQFLPTGYRTMALGFIGIANNFFAAFGKNNPTQVKVYDDNGKLFETTQTSYEYDKNGIVTSAEQTLTNADNVATVRKIIFEFVCL
ncbi:hypothetical protein [Emticicia soli]|uniref:DUF4595 domain-containing protein n=1 Tax=Emticicia soli TaxID=2027878 RepID=A0ABW5JDK4_9BACT